MRNYQIVLLVIAALIAGFLIAKIVKRYQNKTSILTGTNTTSASGTYTSTNATIFNTGTGSGTGT